jgi:hypothetical protein
LHDDLLEMVSGGIAAAIESAASAVPLVHFEVSW